MRSELFHPLVSHFPIVLFSLYPVVAGVLLFIKQDHKENYKDKLLFLSRCLIYLGLLMHFLSMYLGDMALEKIINKLCKLQLVYEHEHLAKMILLFIILIVILDVLEISQKVKQIKLLYVGKFVLSIVALWYVFQTGHSGATLVYDYGAAVEVPASCKSN